MSSSSATAQAQACWATAAAACNAFPAGRQRLPDIDAGVMREASATLSRSPAETDRSTGRERRGFRPGRARIRQRHQLFAVRHRLVCNFPAPGTIRAHGGFWMVQRPALAIAEDMVVNNRSSPPPAASCRRIRRGMQVKPALFAVRRGQFARRKCRLVARKSPAAPPYRPRWIPRAEPAADRRGDRGALAQKGAPVGMHMRGPPGRGLVHPLISLALKGLELY